MGEDARSTGIMRETITTWLVGLLCAIVALAFAGVLLGDKVAKFADLKALLDVIVTPVIALLSTVLGFYFGTQSAKDK